MKWCFWRNNKVQEIILSYKHCHGNVRTKAVKYTFLAHFAQEFFFSIFIKETNFHQIFHSIWFDCKRQREIKVFFFLNREFMNLFRKNVNSSSTVESFEKTSWKGRLKIISIYIHMGKKFTAVKIHKKREEIMRNIMKCIGRVNGFQQTRLHK